MVAIKDFEMPKKCIWDCPLCNEEGGACQLSDVKTSGVKRPSDCPLVEAIPKADYEDRLKADMAAMLEDLDLQIDEFDSGCGWDGYIKKIDLHELIQQNINKLKGDQDE